MRALRRTEASVSFLIHVNIELLPSCHLSILVDGECKAETPTTTKAQSAMMDSRLEAMSQAVKTLRPAFDAFYASLDSQQQQRLDVFGPRHRSWRW